jgi:hypothetical protein
MGSKVDFPAEKRAIRLRIARVRRRIDRRLRAVEREGWRLVSWRTWLRWPPARSLLASLGSALATSGRRGPARWIRVLGRSMARRAKDPALAAALRHLADLWKRSVSGQEKSDRPAPEGGNHG